MTPAVILHCPPGPAAVAVRDKAPEVVVPRFVPVCHDPESNQLLPPAYWLTVTSGCTEGSLPLVICHFDSTQLAGCLDCGCEPSLLAIITPPGDWGKLVLVSVSWRSLDCQLWLGTGVTL